MEKKNTILEIWRDVAGSLKKHFIQEKIFSIKRESLVETSYCPV